MTGQKTITFDDFLAVDLRVGTVVRVEDFPEAHKPAYKLWVDIGGGEIKKSSAQITHHYRKEELLNKQVLCVTNFPPRQIGPVQSEVLVCGFYDENGHVILAVPDKTAPNGAKLG